MDQDLKAYLDERFARLEERATENSQQIEGLQEESRHTRVLIEGMWNNVRLVAERVMGAVEQQAALRNEMIRGFEDVKASIAPAYRDLDRRVQWLEDRAK